MKEKIKMYKKPICVVVMALCLFLLLGCTGTTETGGDLITYTVQGSVLLIITIIAGIIGGIFG